MVYKLNSVKCKVVLVWSNKNKVMQEGLETREKQNKAKQNPPKLSLLKPHLVAEVEKAKMKSQP